MKIELKLEKEKGIFELIDETNNIVGELTFLLRENKMIVNHTGVNVELRNQGLAEKLVLKAVEYARDKKLKIIPYCSYVNVYISKHPEVQDVI